MKLTKEEREWILEQIEVQLDSHRIEVKFKGTFSEDLSKEERDTMKSIYEKLKSEDKRR